jgi:hypothetical protein
MGLTPISPTMEVVPVAEIPDFANTIKSPAVPRFTGGGDCDKTVAGIISKTIKIIPK